MRLSSVLGAAALLAVACSPAFADELFTLTDGTNTITFTLPTNPTVTVGADMFVVPNVSVDIDGSIMTDSVYFYDGTVAPPGGLAIFSSGTNTTYLNQSGDVLFGGSIDSPTFSNGGPFALTNFDSSVYSNNFTLNITTAGTPATPEPSSIVLLGTGLLGVAGAMRRRLA